METGSAPIAAPYMNLGSERQGEARITIPAYSKYMLNPCSFAAVRPCVCGEAAALHGLSWPRSSFLKKIRAFLDDKNNLRCFLE